MGPSQLKAQEAPLRAFTKRMAGLRDHHYWDRLSITKMLSTERRVDRYRTIYVWKVVRGLVPNPGLSWWMDGRRGLKVAIRPLSGSRAAIRTLRDRGFMIEAPRVFNSLPSEIRAFEGSPLALKGMVDRLLAVTPDHPLSDTRVTLATDDHGIPSNGLRHWMRIRGIQTYSVYLHGITHPGV